MYKDENEYSMNNPLRNFIYSDNDKFHDGVCKRAHSDQKIGFNRLSCQLTVLCDTKIVNKKFIRII